MRRQPEYTQRFLQSFSSLQSVQLGCMGLFVFETLMRKNKWTRDNILALQHGPQFQEVLTDISDTYVGIFKGVDGRSSSLCIQYQFESHGGKDRRSGVHLYVPALVSVPC